MVKLIQASVFVAAAAMIGILLYWQVEIIRLGGPVMIPIIMCSVFSVAITVERLYYFFQLHLGADIEGFFKRLRDAVDGHQWKEAHSVCEAWRGPVARVALAGLQAHEGSPQEMDEIMEETAHEELPAVEQHLRWLSTLAQVSTLLGLLGTVTGLVRAFQVIQAKAGASGNPVSPGDLAGGVWEALITTVAGLIIAIPTILAYNYFAGRVSEVQFQMEKAAAIISGWRRRPGLHAAG
jgi:biopolymer transport protein ExbB